jgi:hypothetical protein
MRKGLQELLDNLPDVFARSACEGGLVDLFKAIGQVVFPEGGDSETIPDEPSAAEKKRALVRNLPALLASDWPAPPGPKLDLDSVRDQLLGQLEPAKTIGDRLGHRLNRARRDLSVLDTIMPAPRFPQPMYKPLQTVSKDYICPGIENIKDNTVALLATNSRFIESYMCGLSHEFAAELLWREYPTDQRGTYFKQFWEPVRSVAMEDAAKAHLGAGATSKQIEDAVGEMLEDIRAIDEWRGNALGDNPSALASLRMQPAAEGDPECEDDEKVVVVIRGNLLKKYPRTEISIYRERDGASTNTKVEAFFDEYKQTANADGADTEATLDGGRIFEPSIRADVPPDITLIGFDIRVCDLLTAKHYLVLEEQVDRVRYGLDISHDEAALDNWDNLSWDHFGMNVPEMMGSYLNGSEPEGDAIPSDNKWGRSAAEIAKITQQKPVRIAISLNDMIPPELLGGEPS